MQVPTRHVADVTEPTGPHRPVRLTGDAHVTVTAPFYPDGDPLVPPPRCTAVAGEDLEGHGALLRRDLPLHLILQGTLTFQQPTVATLTSFVGGDEWLAGLEGRLNQAAADRSGEAIFDQVELSGMLFPDGYGSVAVTLRLRDGWEPSRRASTLAAVGAAGRELLAAQLRSELLPPLQGMLGRSGAGEAVAVELPYFNLTYAGATDHPLPGRSTLDDELRGLVYPGSSMPLPSFSPWLDEFLYTGYAYHLLAMKDPVPNLRKLALLLLILNVSYARLARFATAAEHALLNREHFTDVGWLANVERQLRAEYQALVTPTFSFDHHALKVRDAVLDSWDVPKLQARTDNLLSTVRNAVELKMAQDHARRVQRLNWIVAVLTALSIIPTAEAVYRLFWG